ncbi:hypothetical protein A9Q84_06355 [Halobacteriovorax marinus]|uniref:LD-carboxypeptidase n=1 Tax=Halobacteriovorax marinus TaxID=97084 RepID=A0A1Y5F9T5_9BACT|nr:hypothetical protein A9Q84_06355 [Halobacteriovorax marinus]
MKELILPKFLKPGDTIGVFTPSSPSYKVNPELFDNGIKNLEEMGFKVKLGTLTSSRSHEGYRSASGEERAREFMELINDPKVRGLISTIGGYNSNSMIEYLDFDLIAKSRKVICGYSDVTSLHLAILKYSRLRTFYGPAVMCWLGEWPNGISESTDWFLQAVMNHTSGEREVKCPKKWSNHMRDWRNGDWKNVKREWQENTGWTSLSSGTARAPIIAANLNTLMSAAGTDYWPELKGRILLIEEMDAPLSKEERHLTQLKLMGVFDQIAGLIISKPEVYSSEGAPFTYDELIVEVVGERDYPIITNFDCGHIVPMVTIPSETLVEIISSREKVTFKFLEESCSE